MHYKTCEVCGIKSGRTNNEKRLFMAKIPLNEERCKQWVKVVGKEDLAYVPIEKLHMLKHVCGKHFKPTDFKKKKTQLNVSAIPSICLMSQPLGDDLLIDFPLHVANQEVTKMLNDESASQIVMEHNYCTSLVSENKRPHSPEPSTSQAYAIHKKKTKKESYQKWWKEKQSLTYPTINLCKTVDAASKLFEKEVLPCLYRHNLCAYSKTIMLSSIDFTWVCDNHRSKVVNELTQRLSLLLIRNECKIVNRSFAICEEPIADSLKKAEQQAIAK